MADQDTKATTEAKVVTIKKYANRRLYNTASSSYVTLDHLARMVKEGVDFVVYDAKSGDDITRSVLTQIIVEEEAKGTNLLPIGFLRQLISFYGDSMQWVVPKYLEQSMQMLARNQEQMREMVQQTLGGVFPVNAGVFSGSNPIEEMGKQNLAMMERAMRMFAAFQPGAAGAPDSPSRADSDKAIEDLQARLDELQRQLGALTGGERKG